MSLRDVGGVKDTTTLTLRHPNPRKPDPLNADGTPMTITIHGPYSARYKAVLRERQQKWLSQGDKDGRQLTLTPEEVEESTRSTILACIEDWSLTLEGDEKLPFSPEAVTQVFEEFPWVYDQVAAAMGDISNFLDAPIKH
jgi:hypothetical protein